MGVKRTGDLLEKLTWGLAITLMVLSLSTHVYLQDNVESSGLNSSTLERAEEQTILPPSSTMPIEGTGADDAPSSDLEGLVEDDKGVN